MAHKCWLHMTIQQWSTYMCQPQGQNLANVVFMLLHWESGTPCHSISVLLPSADNSSGLGSKPTSLSAPTHDSPPRTVEECNYLLTYLLIQRWLTDCQAGDVDGTVCGNITFGTWRLWRHKFRYLFGQGAHIVTHCLLLQDQVIWMPSAAQLLLVV